MNDNNNHQFNNDFNSQINNQSNAVQEPFTTPVVPTNPENISVENTIQQSAYSEPKKKKNKILFIIIGIILIGIIVFLIIKFIPKKDGKLVTNNTNAKTSSEIAVINFHLNSNSENNNKLFVDYSSSFVTTDGFLYSFDSDGIVATKSYSSKKLEFVPQQLSNDYFYLSTDNDLYFNNYLFSSSSAKTYNEDFPKIGSDVVDFKEDRGCLLALTKKGEVYGYNMTMSDDSYRGRCGLDKRYDFEKILDNVKSIYAYYDEAYYVNLDNELYYKTPKTKDFVKLTDNVKEFEYPYVLDNNNIVYYITEDFMSNNKKTVKKNEKVDKLFHYNSSQYEGLTGYIKNDRLYFYNYDYTGYIYNEKIFDKDEIGQYYFNIEKASNIKNVLFMDKAYNILNDENDKSSITIYIDKKNNSHIISTNNNEKVIKFDSNFPNIFIDYLKKDFK